MKPSSPATTRSCRSTHVLPKGRTLRSGSSKTCCRTTPYKLDDTFITKGWVQVAEGTKGGETRQWGDNSHENYLKIDPEAQRRTLAFIERNARAGKPFYVANWPNLTSFIPNPKKTSLSRSILQDGLESNIDPFVGRIIAKLRELNIAENTLLVCMADNGPMTHNPPPGLGMAETIFRGGKGDFLEGGVRVPAQAWWPGMIEPGQLAGDIIHETDLFTTFARVAGALQYVPTDRIIDGIDQTSLLVNGGHPQPPPTTCSSMPVRGSVPR